LKFQDSDEISAYDIADAFEQMWTKGRYNEIFFMIDTCQANTMYSKFYSPNILAIGSSEKGENSYSHHQDSDIGIAVIDRFTHHTLNFLEKINQTSKSTMKDFFDSFDPQELLSNPGVRTDLLKRPVEEILLTDFFGGSTEVELSNSSVDDLEPFPIWNNSDVMIGKTNMNTDERLLFRDQIISSTRKENDINEKFQEKRQTGSALVTIGIAIVAQVSYLIFKRLIK